MINLSQTDQEKKEKHRLPTSEVREVTSWPSLQICKRIIREYYEQLFADALDEMDKCLDRHKYYKAMGNLSNNKSTK